MAKRPSNQKSGFTNNNTPKWRYSCVISRYLSSHIDIYIEAPFFLCTILRECMQQIPILRKNSLTMMCIYLPNQFI